MALAGCLPQPISVGMSADPMLCECCAAAIYMCRCYIYICEADGVRESQHRAAARASACCCGLNALREGAPHHHACSRGEISDDASSGSITLALPQRAEQEAATHLPPHSAFCSATSACAAPGASASRCAR